MPFQATSPGLFTYAPENPTKQTKKPKWEWRVKLAQTLQNYGWEKIYLRGSTGDQILPYL